MVIARVFHRTGVPVEHFPYKAWRAACKRAKLWPVTTRFPPDVARNYRRSGEAEGVIMRIGGWRTRSVFERYNVMNEDDLKRAAERVTDRSGARTGQILPMSDQRRS